MRRITSLAIAALICFSCASRSSSQGRPSVVASFYPLAFATSQIGDGRVRVTNLTPPGVEPHDVELTSGQVAALEDADLLVYAGRGFQPAVELLASARGDAALDVLAEMRLRPGFGDAEEAPEVDPHVWLDPTRLAAIGDAIAGRLAALDPGNARAYRRAAAALRSRLRALDRAYASGLEGCVTNRIVTSHEAFGYLAHRYGLIQVGISGLDPEAEPSPRRVAEITELVRSEKVRTVFFESLVSPRVAQTIAAETGVRTDVLDPIEGPPEDGDYFDAMRSNLRSLREALGCD